MNSLGAGGNFDYGGRGPSDAIAYPNLYQVFGDKSTEAVKNIKSSLKTWATSQASSALNASALEKIYQIQAGSIIDHNAHCSDTGYPRDIGIDMWQLLPFSRGTVTIRSNDPFTKPAINVSYFSVDWDIQVQVESAL